MLWLWLWLYILGPSPVPPIYLAGSFGLVRHQTNEYEMRQQGRSTYGSLCEYIGHDCEKRRVACVLYLVLLPMCPTDGPMARGATRDIPGNSLGQGFTSTST